MSSGLPDAEALIKEMIALESRKKAIPVLNAFHDTQPRGDCDEQELVELKRWIRSLSYDDLTRAMEFAFHSEGNCDGDGRGSSCEEYELVEQMISMQPPPPTPIHPRAVPYKPASAHGITDGRNEEKRRLRCRFETPRLFQFIERNSAPSFSESGLPHSLHQRHQNGVKKRAQNKHGKQRRHFDLLARKFSSPWGDTLTVGSTHEQRMADSLLLRSTHLVSNESGPFRCCFHYALSGKLAARTQDVLRLLHIVSRGKFLSIGLCKDDVQDSRVLPYCSQWFDPTMQWFSLPMYLSSRFELALWTSFRKHAKGSSGSMAASFVMREELLIRDSSDDILKKVVSEALCKAVLEVLKEGLSSGCIRDSLLWKLFCQSTAPILPFSIDRNFAASLCTIPLIETGSTKDRFRHSVMAHLRGILAHHSELLLLSKADAEKSAGVQKHDHRNVKKKNRKKKRRKRQPPTVHKEAEIYSEVHDTRETGESLPPLIPDISYPRPSEERNRNTILALRIIDDVLGLVFKKVGLGTEETQVVSTKLPPKVPAKQKNVIVVRKSGQKKQSAAQTKERRKHVPAVSTKLPPKRESTSSAALAQHTDEPSLSTLSHNSVQPQIQQQSQQHLFPFMNTKNGGSSPFFDATSPLGMSLNFGGAFSEWSGMQRYQSHREKSLFAEFFNKDNGQRDVEELLMAASTAASIASSSGDDQSDIPQVEDADNNKNASVDDDSKSLIVTDDDDKSLVTTNVTEPDRSIPAIAESLLNQNDIKITKSSPSEKVLKEKMLPASPLPSHSPPQLEDAQSPSPSEPPTPPPQLSPIQVSLADIKKLRKQKTPEELRKEFAEAISNKFSSSPEVAGSLRSLPSSPKLDQSKRSWSREDLRAPYFNDDQLLKRRSRGLSRYADVPLSYRNAVAKSLRKASSTSSHDAKYGESLLQSKAIKQRVGTGIEKAEPAVQGPSATSEKEIIEGDFHASVCAQSETALEGHEDSSHWNATPRVSPNDEADNATATRDGSTTISSGRSPPETEETTLLREERNAYRDLCLTLGAEVATLKNQIASQAGKSVYPAVPYISPTYQPAYYYGTSSYDPEYMPSFFHGVHNGSNRTMVAMSDVGIHQEMAVSEDSTDIAQGGLSSVDIPGKPWSGHAGSIGNVRQTSTGGTKTASDACSTEYGHGSVVFGGFRSSHRDNIGSVPLHGLQSRLSVDIENFLRSTSAQLKKQESRRSAATQRLSRLVTALWPRAQVKHYGSHVSNLCLPSSDIDCVICLPAVHKKDIAVAPGVLEGRNAINETSQKMLARKLKGESWIDPRSIKLIERTVVPVIKVSTKDIRARVLQLDISFDGPEHHGSDAVQMVTGVMEELPMVRPLVLVLKQFLLDRGLLAAYTGGLSSYCLFLMVTRYLQEQPLLWNDCGTLLMGFLDFYGNHFEPRSTGISVKRRQYFSRPYYAQQARVHSQHTMDQQVWNTTHQTQQRNNPTAPQLVGDGDFPDLSNRRHSFTEAARGTAGMVGTGVNASPSGKHSMKPPRFHPKRTSSHHSLNQQIPPHTQQHQAPPPLPAGRPYTFDPLFVEDPMNAGNNVGRNAFRIFQVQRAFSDAHRALVASLEWDINSTDGSDYPLLKCLFNNEDTFFDADLPDSRP